MEVGVPVAASDDNYLDDVDDVRRKSAAAAATAAEVHSDSEGLVDVHVYGQNVLDNVAAQENYESTTAALGGGNATGNQSAQPIPTIDEAGCWKRMSTCGKVALALTAISLASTLIIGLAVGLTADDSAGGAGGGAATKPTLKAKNLTPERPGSDASGTTDTIDALAGATAATGFSIKADTLELSASGMGPWSTSVTVTGEGTWAVANGKVVFTPDSGLNRNPTGIFFRASDTQSPAQVAEPAGITLQYTAFGMDSQEPFAPNITLKDQTKGRVSLDVAAKCLPSMGGKILPASVKLDGGNNAGFALTVVNQGTWIAQDDGIISFTPDKALTTNPNPIFYSVGDSNKKRSRSALFKISYQGFADPDLQPVAKPINVTKFDIPQQAQGAPVQLAPVRLLLSPQVTKGTHTVVVASAMFIRTMTPAGTGGLPIITFANEVKDGATIIGFLKVIVTGEGEWTIEPAKADPNDREIVFTPYAGAVEFPTQVYYTVGDDKGSFSKPAPVALYPGLEKAIQAARVLASKSDDDFWNGLKAEIQSVTEIDEMAAIVLTLENLTRVSLGATEAAIASKSGSIPAFQANFQTLLTEFVTAGATPSNLPGKLFDLGAREITDKVTNPMGMALATRYLRLIFMRRIYRAYLAMMADMLRNMPAN